jgi:hypothetical protein
MASSNHKLSGYEGAAGSGAFSMSDRRLRAGDLFRMPSSGRPYLVRHVNESRANCIPVAGEKRTIHTEDGDKTFEDIGGAINISPGACVKLISKEQLDNEQRARAERMETQTTATTGAKLPIPKARKAAGGTKGKSAKGAGAAKSAKPKREKVPATVRKCSCGCGGETTGYFVPGHDARFKGKLLRAERGEDTPEKLLGAKVAGQYKWQTVTRKVNGEDVKGKIPTTNYKGEPHEGYLKVDGTKRAIK